MGEIRRRDKKAPVDPGVELMQTLNLGDIPRALHLIESGADVNFRDKANTTPLMVAAEKGLPGPVEMLLAKGAVVTARNTKGMTPMLFAAASGDIDISELLLARGADINVKDNRGDFPLLVAISNGHIPLALRLIEKGADITLRSESGHTVLSRAARLGNLELVEYFLSRGLSPHPGGSNIISPFLSAIDCGCREVVEKLLDSGADIDERNASGSPALMTASLSGHLPVVELLLQRGAQVNVTNRMGDTPLIVASSVGNYQITALLLVHGADKSIKNQRGETALSIAELCRQEKVAELLRSEKIPTLQELSKSEDSSSISTSSASSELPIPDVVSAAFGGNESQEGKDTSLLAGAQTLVIDANAPRPQKSEAFLHFEEMFFRKRDPRGSQGKEENNDILPILDTLSPAERAEAEDKLVEALDRSFNERWVYGLLYLESPRALTLFRRKLEVERSPQVVLCLLQGILLLEPGASETEYFYRYLQPEAAGYIKVKTLELISKLASMRAFGRRPPQSLFDVVMKNLKDTDEMVRNQARIALHCLTPRTGRL